MVIVNAKKQNDFGSTYDFHSALMALIWGPGINLAILIVLYSYRKYYVYAHSIFGIFITIYTIATSLPILLYTGILSTAQSGGEIKVSGSTIYAHYIVGIVSMAAVLLLALLGVATKLMNIFQFSSISIIVMKNVHRILGYLISILVKSNVYIIYGPSDGNFWLFFVQDFLFLVIIILRKIFFPKMQHVTVIEKTLKTRFYQSLRQLDASTLYCIFANNIYSLQPIRTNHPGGFQIIESVKNRDVDRFIYGMYGSQAHPEVWGHSHSFRSLELLGNPLGRLNIQSCYYGFDQNYQANVTVQEINQISKSGGIFQIKLQKEADRMVFRNYESIAQLGRFYSLTINKVTRLYTSVNFLSPKNKRFMHTLFKNQLPIREEKIYQRERYQPPSNGNEGEYIPLLIKSYPKGKLSENLIKNPTQQVIISQQRGEGLGLQSLSSHKIAIIAGGTGFFPFYDLIDLLFKNQLLKSGKYDQNAIIKISPILEKYAFQNLHLRLYLAVNSIQDIHPIIFCQLVFLLQSSNNFHLTLRVKELNNEFLIILRQNKNVTLDSLKFEQMLEEKLNQSEVQRIYICGPPRMNESLNKYFRDRCYENKLIHFL